MQDQRNLDEEGLILTYIEMTSHVIISSSKHIGICTQSTPITGRHRENEGQLL